MKNFRRFFAIAVIAVLAIFAMYHTQRAFSLSDARHDMFAENNIIFYDPDESAGCTNRSSCNMEELTMEDLDAIGSNSGDRLREIVRVYGPLAMDLQREYGIPWEIVFGMMHKESNAGAAENSIARSVWKDGGKYNFLGMQNSKNHRFNDDYKYNSNGADWAGYGSMSKMIIGYTIDYLRNGNSNYTAGIKSLEGSGYDLETYTKLILKSYCPTTDNCEHNSYWSAVKYGINIAAEVAAEQGWPSSKELFEQEKIPEGGAFGEVGKDIRDEAFEKYGACGLPGNTPSTSVSANNVGASDGGSASLHAPTGDGWLSDLDGFVKDPVPSNVSCDGCSSYTTSSGLPQFIVLHYTAGASFSGVGVYTRNRDNGSGQYNVAPHFSIDVKQHKIYQHIPLTQTSGAVKNHAYDSMSVQIEIVGVGYSNWHPDVSPSDPTNLKNFTEDEWAYVADLLIGINKETGIPLQSSLTWGEEWKGTKTMPDSEVKNYVGVLGHMHIQDDKMDPGDIWGDVSAALAKKGYIDGMGGSCVGGSGVPAGFVEAVLAYAWPEYHSKPYVEMKPAYKQLVEDSLAGKNDLYVGGSRYPGVDCNGFVSILVVTSGLDPNYNNRSASRNTTAQIQYLENPENGWEKIKEQGVATDTSMLQPGDVAINDGHTFIYVGHIEGFDSVWASASLDGRAPMASSSGESADNYKLFRKK